MILRAYDVQLLWRETKRGKDRGSDLSRGCGYGDGLPFKAGVGDEHDDVGVVMPEAAVLLAMDAWQRTTVEATSGPKKSSRQVPPRPATKA